MARHQRRTYPDLRTYFDESGDTQTRFAERIHRSQPWLSRVVNGHLEPSIHEALVIARLAGVPLESLAVDRREFSQT
jgi:transcriptional regulator with XRE-family HTH domain